MGHAEPRPRPQELPGPTPELPPGALVRRLLGGRFWGKKQWIATGKLQPSVTDE